MSADPLLILQLQRMGDIILTFPLVDALRGALPKHPILVVADPAFSGPLSSLAPQVTFVSPNRLPDIARGRYHLAINLSSAPRAAECLGSVEAGTKLGPAMERKGLRIHGPWQLYRASLTQNNRHNRFHWSDLHALDLAPMAGPDLFGHPPRTHGKGDRLRVGLVLGASEEAKRPDADFWARLAMRLAREGIWTILLGGKAEESLGAQVAAKAKLPDANMCGRLSLEGLARTLRILDLCVTPDTGPMHLADRLGVPVLNLSMGPVNARETGPVSPGQTVLRAAMSCAGCWQCTRLQAPCRQRFTAAAVAQAILSLLKGARPERTLRLTFLATARGDHGLHRLDPVHQDAGLSCRDALETFWQAAFLALHGVQDDTASKRLGELAAAHPVLHDRMRRHLLEILAGCASHTRRRETTAPKFWMERPPCVRLFTGYLHMALQNGDHDASAWRTVLGHLERVLEFFRDGGA
ncbi:MAG: glycosyltransferase family 9 protein [Desulfovibrio sp.]|nr:glycosyltransferase family 9 protein [Desulfovibrio sp.]